MPLSTSQALCDLRWGSDEDIHRQEARTTVTADPCLGSQCVCGVQDDQVIDITLRTGFSPGVGAEQNHSLGVQHRHNTRGDLFERSRRDSLCHRRPSLDLAAMLTSLPSYDGMIELPAGKTRDLLQCPRVRDTSSQLRRLCNLIRHPRRWRPRQLHAVGRISLRTRCNRMCVGFCPSKW